MNFKLLKNQKFIFWLFQAVLMITSVLLLFTEPSGACVKIANILFPLGVQIILFCLTRRPGIVFLILFPKLFFDAFQFALINLYGGSIIGSDMFLNVVTTSASEAGEVLASLTGTILMVFLIYIPSIILAIKSAKSKEKIEWRWRKKILYCGGIILAASIIFITSACRFKDDIYPVNVIYNLEYATKKWNRVEKYNETSKGFTYNAFRENGKTREIVVLVLGETSRAANWSLYGYSRETSPHTDSLASSSNPVVGGGSNLVVFKDFLTQSNTTHKSVPIILSPAEAGRYGLLYKSKSIVSAFKEAGFKTIYIKNQNYDKSIVHSYYNEADEKISVSSKIRSVPDEAVLPELNKVLQKDTTGNLFIIIHLYGSHFAYHSRYPKQFAYYTPDRPKSISKKYRKELINSYDNSILNTDYVTFKIIEAIKSQNAGSVVMCLADHGEDLMDDRRGRFLHASLNATYYQLHIPFYVWFSDNYIKNCRDKYEQTIKHSSAPLSTNAVFHSLLDYAEIHTKYLDSTLCIGSPRLEEKEREYLTDHDIPMKLRLLPLTKYDYEQFEARGMKVR